jgi:hypothetical protein
VYHRKAGSRRSDDKFSAPLLMWLPAGETYDASAHVVPAPSAAGRTEPEYMLAGDAPLWRHVRRMLRPFQAVPALRQQPPPDADVDTAEAAADQPGPAGSSGAQDVSMAAAASPYVCASPEPACTSKSAPVAAAMQGTTTPPGAGTAGSEAADGDSTWGSQGSGSPRSDAMEMDALDAAAAADGGAACCSASASPPPALPASPAGSAGEVDASAALAMQELGVVGGSICADGAPAAAAAAAPVVSGAVPLGSGGVPAAPLDIWALQQTAAPPPAGGEGTPAAALQANGTVLPSWPPYVLKLARDTGDVSSTVSPWYASHFHPHVRHSTFVLDWELRTVTRVTHVEYQEAAEAAAAAAMGTMACGNEQQEQEQHAGSAQKDQSMQHDGLALDAAEQQQQQHQGAAAVSPPPPVDGSFWRPDMSGIAADGSPLSPATAQPDLQVLGEYVLQPLQQPEFDSSTAAIRAARADPRGKSVGLEACVEAFLQPEQLSEADEWYCPKCKKHVQVRRTSAAGTDLCSAAHDWYVCVCLCADWPACACPMYAGCCSCKCCCKSLAHAAYAFHASNTHRLTRSSTCGASPRCSSCT